MELSRLFSPITINGLTLKNRMLMPALNNQYAENGYATPRFNQYYWRRAEGGVGLLVVGGCQFDAYGPSHNMMSLVDDSYIPGWKEFTDGCHAR